MRSQCSYCKRFKQYGSEQKEEGPVSHGICPRCSFCNEDLRDLYSVEELNQRATDATTIESNEGISWIGADSMEGKYEPMFEKLFVRIQSRARQNFEQKRELESEGKSRK